MNPPPGATENMTSSSDHDVIGGFLVVVMTIIGLPIDSATETETTEEHQAVASATDARVTGGKIRHRYQVEILVTRDERGELHKIDCPMPRWIESKEGDTVKIKHEHHKIFDDKFILIP